MWRSQTAPQLQLVEKIVAIPASSWTRLLHAVGVQQQVVVVTVQKTADSPQVQFMEGRRYPYCVAVTDGPDCSELH